MFRDQKLQVSSCVSNQKHDFLIYKKEVQVPFLFKFNIKIFVQ